MTTSLAFSLEEFSARRRGDQGKVEQALLPLVKEVLAKGEPYDWSDVLAEVAHQWSIYYQDESGVAKAAPRDFLDDIRKALEKTKDPDRNTAERAAILMSTAILSHSTVESIQDDDEELFSEWVTMEDKAVRESHKHAHGQQRPVGENFTVGGYKMPYPGYPGVPIELWINCRCTLRPVIANSMAASFRDVPPGERNKRAEDGTALPDGSFPIANCSDLKNAVQAIGRARDPAKAKAHIRKRKRALGCPDVDLPWATVSLHMKAEFNQFQKVMEETIAQVEAMTFALPLDEPTHAGVAVIARDSGRILMIQRQWDEEDDPDVRGTWEFPGGGIEEGEEPQEAAWREFCEETGLPMPEGEIVNGWRSPDGVYQGYVCAVPVEADAFEELNPDVDAADTINPDNPERIHPDITAWFTVEQLRDLGPALRPEVAKMDWSVLDLSGEEKTAMSMSPSEIDMDLPAPEQEDAPPPEKAPQEQISVPWHGVLTVEGKKSGDGRRFTQNALRTRPLPTPLTWQKQSQSGHDGNITVATIETMKRATAEGEIRASGYFLMTPEADEVLGLIAAFGRFGVSIDADDSQFELNEDDECVDFSSARSAGACIVPIPAFSEAWVSLGDAPEGFLDGDGVEDVAVLGPNDEPAESLVAAMVAAYGESFVDVAPGRTEDGPGWLTHPVDTDRLRDYWVRGPGAAKIGWGTPGDFNRCRVEVGKYVAPQHINGYCANRHYDALGFWPGRPVSGDTIPMAGDSLEFTDASPAISLVASSGVPDVAPAAWFKDPEFSTGDPRLVKDHDGNYGCPLTITKEGEVYGHLAGWRTCHSLWDDTCVLAPHSQTNYAYFRLGEVLTDEGPVAVGPLTIGGGHAPMGMSMRAAIEHYDDASTVWADVNVGEDEFGIWVHGWVRPGTTPEMVHAARASKPSGDWRWSANVGGLEMIAGHSVNTPGYAVPRIAAATKGTKTMALVAAGFIDFGDEQQEQQTPEIESIVEQVWARLEAKQQREATVASLREFAEED